jgi:hypothetical protein
VKEDVPSGGESLRTAGPRLRGRMVGFYVPETKPSPSYLNNNKNFWENYDKWKWQSTEKQLQRK